MSKDTSLFKHRINADFSDCLVDTHKISIPGNIWISEYANLDLYTDTLSFIPSSQCTWMICYNVKNDTDSCFYCIGPSDSIMDLEIKNYSNYIFITFDDNMYYFNKNLSDATPSDFFNQIFECCPSDSSDEYKLTVALADIDNFAHRVDAVIKYFKTNKELLIFPDNILRIYNEIKKNNGNISISNVALVSGYSVRHVNRIFTEYFGYGPKEYCKLLRFHKTLSEILRDPMRSNSEFIQNIGYSDQAHFQREFKAFMGETPKQFIKKLSQTVR